MYTEYDTGAIPLLSAKKQTEFLQFHAVPIYELLDVDKLYPSLHQENLVDKEWTISIEGQSRERKISELLEILPRKGPDAIRRFTKCLKQTQDDADHKQLYKILLSGSDSQPSGMLNALLNKVTNLVTLYAARVLYLV